jgi:pimeloyl-ACP methyl ester carboxylesterase
MRYLQCRCLLLSTPIVLPASWCTGVVVSTILITWTLLLLAAPRPALAEKPAGSAYLDGGESRIGLILCHGRGAHPKWKVVNPLRKRVNRELGFHTLSLQMPNDDKDWRKYAGDFPRAYAIIDDGIRYLVEEKGVDTIYLMGHSMGSRMASSYLAEIRDHMFSGLIIAGCWNNGGQPFNCRENIKNVGVPILDIWGGGDAADSKAARERWRKPSPAYTQVEIPGAGHRFEGHNDEFVAAVVNWLKAQE